MARARKSHEPGEEEAKPTRSKLPPAYSPRVDGHTYVIYSTVKKEGDPYARSIVHKFLARYAAAWYVKKVIGSDTVEWAKWLDRDDMLVTSSGIQIRAASDQMKELYPYEPTGEEVEWKDELLLQSVMRFRHGRHEALAAANDDNHRHPEQPDIEGSTVTPEKRGKREKPAREPKVVKPKPNLDGFVSANDIAKQLKVEGREVRGVLRGLKLTKPEHGWSWPKDEAKKMKATIEDELKKIAKKKGKK